MVGSHRIAEKPARLRVDNHAANLASSIVPRVFPLDPLEPRARGWKARRARGPGSSHETVPIVLVSHLRLRQAQRTSSRAGPGLDPVFLRLRPRPRLTGHTRPLAAPV